MAADPTPGPGAPRRAQPNDLRAHRILVVDDSEDAAEALVILLRELGQSVRKAVDGRTALLLAAQFKPEIVFIDIVMPRMDGFELAAGLRDMTGLDAVRLVAVSGYGGDSLKAMTSSNAFDTHLRKPVTAKDLVRLLGAP